MAFDGTGSSDSDGTISEYAWDFDDDGRSELVATVGDAPRVVFLREAAGVLEVFDTVDLTLPADSVHLARLFDGTVGMFTGNGARVILAAHFGRPKGKRYSTMSTSFVQGDVEEVLGAVDHALGGGRRDEEKARADVQREWADGDLERKAHVEREVVRRARGGDVDGGPTGPGDAAG